MELQGLGAASADYGRRCRDFCARGYVLAKEKIAVIWALIPQTFQRWVIKGGIVSAILLAVVGLRACDVQKQRRIGYDRHAAQVETATNESVSKAGRAGRKSADPDAGGMRNPHYRD